MPTIPATIRTQTVTITTAARILGYNDPEAVRKLIRSGQLYAFRANGARGATGAWRIPVSSIRALLRETP